ncbi:MAG: hypothetical protein H7Y37_14255 [Anaerolineae bacterium]|nr:hypothetical protein [Gloeobacterales cyanobacterium ES-bin-313]
MNRLFALSLALLLGTQTVVLAETPALPIDPVLLKQFKARSIGPAVMGGRVSEIAMDPKNPYKFYVALGTGGLMKTEDNGASFTGIFEEESVAAVGAVAVAPSDPKVLWVGTGEANDRNSSSWGNGVYRSTDGGATWKNVGLKNSKTIARIIAHPTDPKTAWVAAAGDLWSYGTGRGIYKTTDGGATWKAVLTGTAPYADRLGGGDLAIDPKDPDTLYATLYARRRQPWAFVAGPDATDGKDVGGIFKSTDGGNTWKKLTEGLPTRTGRIGLSVYAKNPKIVYAIVQSDEGGTSSIDEVKSKKGGVFRSEDSGEHWTRVNPLNPRPFYFSQIRVDPTNDKRVYVLGFIVHVSDNGGRNFREDLSKKVHSDHHALVIDPKNPERLLLGGDGGIYQSYSGGESWDHLNRIAAGEFYRINVDQGTPYRICGGLQDNENWVGPSQVKSKEGILNADWIAIGGGDGFYCFFDRENPNLVFAESQEGYVIRRNLANGEVKELRPEPAEGQSGFRFHWNSPLIPSLHAKGSLFLAGNRVFKMSDYGKTWKAISPDLSTKDPIKTTTTGSGAENYGVVYTLAESPKVPGLLWAGTDDGKLWITKDEGANWTDLTANLPAEAQGQWMSRIEASSHDPQVAFLAVDAHRSSLFTPLAYRTADGGKTWQSISGNLPINGPVKVVREDPVNPDLLYAGTEFGLFVSFDQGKNWAKLGDLPTVAVDDLVVQPQTMDLVVATHGRSLFIFDDIRPLQQISSPVIASEAHLFTPATAQGFYQLPGFAEQTGDGIYRGDNRDPGALISFYIKNYTGDTIKLVITNSDDQPVANFKSTGTPGLNRVIWDLMPTKDFFSEYGGQGVTFVKSGEYKVTLTYGKIKQSQKFQVQIAPGIETR